MIRKHIEILIRVKKSETLAFYAALARNLHRGWTRPQSLQPRPGTFEEDAACYVCKRRANRKAAAVALFRSDPQTLAIANVVPKDCSQLSPDEYNAILRDFRKNVLGSVPGFPIELRKQP